MLRIRAFRDEDEAAVVALWRDCGLTRPWNDPHKDIARKRMQQREMFFVGTREERPDEIVATAMVGYDGHRGWVYYLAIAPGYQRLALGRRMMAHAEGALLAQGCPKINLQVRSSNAGVIDFYRKLGYAHDEAVSLGKRLIPDGLPHG